MPEGILEDQPQQMHGTIIAFALRSTRRPHARRRGDGMRQSAKLGAFARLFVLEGSSLAGMIDRRDRGKMLQTAPHGDSRGDRRPRHPADSGRRRSARVACWLCVPVLVPFHAALAFNLGGHEVQSSLGQRLRLVVQVAARADEQFDAGCFKVNPYAVASDGLPQLTNAQVVLERSNGQSRLLISSPRPINDPVLRISIEVGCETALRRDLTLLLDPPPDLGNVPETAAAATPGAATTRPPSAAGSGTAGASDATAASGVQTAPATASAAAGNGAPDSSGGAAATSTRERPPATGRTADTAARRTATATPRVAAPRAAAGEAARNAPVQTGAAPSGSAARAPLPAVAARSAARDRLTISGPSQSLETQSAPLTPRLTLATTLSERPQQPLPESVLGMLRQKQARLRAAPVGEDMPSLEAELVVLQRRTAELRTQLDTAMAQMQVLAGKQLQGDAAPAPKAATPATAPEPAAAPLTAVPDAQVAGKGWFDTRTLVVAGLTLLIGMLVAGLVVWVRHERSDRRRMDRWNASPYVPVTRVSTVLPTPPVRPVTTPSPADSDSSPAFNVHPAPQKERAPLPESYAFTPFSTPHAANQLGVSDLAQATEKASVFVTLGRPEQAIDVLRDHIDHEPKPSPMAWLMLIDLYRKSNRRAEFDDVAERFHKLFNAETPHWEQQAGRVDEGLAAFPRLVGLIRKGWPHAEALGAIENLLYDNRGGQRVGFSLPAFRDLLLLHSILEEHLIEMANVRDGRAADDTDAPVPPPHLAKVWATAPVPVAEAPALALELDTSLLSDSPESSALEKGLPVVAEAIVHRWGKPGVADYLTNLIALSKDDRNSDVSTEMMGELLMLQDVACVLEESRARDLSF
jgi:hypothetical protein